MLAGPRWLSKVHSRTNARYTTNRKMVDDQHRWARAFQRLVTGSQTRLPTISPAAPSIVLCSLTPSSRSATTTTAASTTVPPIAKANRRIVGHAPVVRAGRAGVDEQRDGADRRGNDPGQHKRSEHSPAFRRFLT